jgi:hypothetical protein
MSMTNTTTNTKPAPGSTAQQLLGPGFHDFSSSETLGNAWQSFKDHPFMSLLAPVSMLDPARKKQAIFERAQSGALGEKFQELAKRFPKQADFDNEMKAYFANHGKARP